MRLEIQKALDTLRPMLQADGGDLEFVDYFNRIVYVRLTGACEGCPHANVTIKNGIEKTENINPNCSPKCVIEELKLNRPIYKKLCQKGLMSYFNSKGNPSF